MTRILQERFELVRANENGGYDTGGIPGVDVQIQTTSGQKHNTAQIVGTSHEVISAGDVTDDALVYLRCNHTSAVVQYGVVVGGTFYPLAECTNALGWVKLGFASALADFYLKSDTASTEVEVMLHKIVEPV